MSKNEIVCIYILSWFACTSIACFTAGPVGLFLSVILGLFFMPKGAK